MSKIINDYSSCDPRFFDVVTYTGEGVARDLYNITPVQDERSELDERSEPDEFASATVDRLAGA